jgi:uncharacterized protein
MEDLQAVVDHLKNEFGYVVDLVVGHSRGSIVGFRWLATSEDGRKAAAYVNVSGRYRMEVRNSTHCLSVPLNHAWRRNAEDNRLVGFAWSFDYRGLMLFVYSESEGGQRWVEGFSKQGYYEWSVTVARKPILARINPEDLKEFVAWDTSFVWNDFPQHTDVLTVHGLQDATVPPWV